MRSPYQIRIVRIALRCLLAAAFCPLLPTDLVGGPRLDRATGGAWVPSPTIPISLSRLLLVGF
jgi:hypothetical protein